MDANMGERQRWAWMAAAVSAIAAAEICRFHWVWVLSGGFAAVVYQIWLDRRIGKKGLAQILVHAFGRFGKLLVIVALVWTVVLMGWTAGLADKAFPMVEGFPGLGWVLLGLAAWGSWKGPAACVRCCGVLCLFLLVLYGLIGGFAVPDVKSENMQVTGMWSDAVWVFGLFLLPAATWYMPCTGSRKGPSWFIMAVVLFLTVVLTAVTAGVLSPVLVEEESVPMYALAQSVSLFGVIERIEPLLSAAITMGVFSLLSMFACVFKTLADQIVAVRWSGIVSCGAAAGVMFLTKGLTVQMLTFGVWIFAVMIPLGALLFDTLPKEFEKKQ